tara:strand:- start:139 stop:1149 length:1011 start_codon:yes stop_codon:yes gene_type:complete
MKIIITITALIISICSYSQCKSGDCENGTGVYIFQGGDYFQGEFQNGEIYKGKITFKESSTTFEGTFLNKKLNGDSCKIITKNQSQIGLFKNGILIKGIYTYKEPNLIQVSEGEFDNSINLINEGILKITNDDGEYIERGFFISGELNDKNGYIKYTDGKIYEGEVKNGTADGIGKLTYPSGGIQKGLYIEGEFQDGININYDEIIKKDTYTIPLFHNEESGLYYIEIEINGTKIKTVFDTGASFLSVDKGYLYSAKKDGLVEKVSSINTRDANNNIYSNDLYLISSIKIAGHEAYLIPTVGKSEGKPSLFGIGVLKRLGSTIIVNLEQNYISVLK